MDKDKKDNVTPPCKRTDHSCGCKDHTFCQTSLCKENCCQTGKEAPKTFSTIPTGITTGTTIPQGITYSRPPIQTGVPNYIPQSYIQQAPITTQYSTAPITTGYTTSAPQTVFSQPQVVTGEAVKGESWIEYVPYERVITEYVEQKRVEYVPVEKKVTDYYQIEHQTEYVPQTTYQTKVEYVPVERVEEKVDYIATRKSYVKQDIKTDVQTVQTPVVQSQVVQTAPIQYVQAPVTTQYVQAPVTTQYVQAPTQYVQSQSTQYVSQVPQYTGMQTGSLISHENLGVIQSMPWAPVGTYTTSGIPTTTTGVRTTNMIGNPAESITLMGNKPKEFNKP